MSSGGRLQVAWAALLHRTGVALDALLLELVLGFGEREGMSWSTGTCVRRFYFVRPNLNISHPQISDSLFQKTNGGGGFGDAMQLLYRRACSTDRGRLFLLCTILRKCLTSSSRLFLNPTEIVDLNTVHDFPAFFSSAPFFLFCCLSFNERN